jgi:hypothetical protein
VSLKDRISVRAEAGTSLRAVRDAAAVLADGHLVSRGKLLIPGRDSKLMLVTPQDAGRLVAF